MITSSKFPLTSGLKSPVYVDCRKIISFVEERKKIINFAKGKTMRNTTITDLLHPCLHLISEEQIHKANP